jgi:hypothetical protein
VAGVKTAKYLTPIQRTAENSMQPIIVAEDRAAIFHFSLYCSVSSKGTKQDSAIYRTFFLAFAFFIYWQSPAYRMWTFCYLHPFFGSIPFGGDRPAVGGGG